MTGGLTLIFPQGLDYHRSVVARARTQWVCQQCEHHAPKRLGRCPGCGGWDTLQEERLATGPGRPGVGVHRPSLSSGNGPQRFQEIQASPDERFSTGIAEFDRVLGGGIVRGSVVLIGGDPGIGKSTLVLQAMDAVARTHGPVLYVSGEESSSQIALRGRRLGVGSKDLFLLAETDLETILAEADRLQPRTMVIDSIQTVVSPQLTSSPGSLSQLRDAATQVMFYAKRTGTATFLIGHVTKEGAIAGPKGLEHIVDTVLYVEGEPTHAYRILRAAKNRFGPTNEVGVFEMNEQGLEPVANPSRLFLGERVDPAPSGTVVVPCLEGTRPFLVEFQALATPTNLPMPRRTTIGVDANRVALLLAVLEKRVGLRTFNHDVFVNVVGGLRVQEPAIDLGVVVSVASSLRERPVGNGTLVFGEVGLAGEVRPTLQAAARVQEGQRLGFRRCVLPKGNLSRLGTLKGIECLGVQSVREALEAAFG